MTQKPEELLRIARRSFELRQEIAFLFESNEKNYVYWFERRNKGVFLTATPIDVSQILRDRLFEKFDTVVLTSATLTVGGRFEFIRQRLGLDHVKERTLPPNSITHSRRLLYLPDNIPDVRDPAFASSAADEIVQLLEHSRGPRLLPLHQLRPDERSLRARAHSRRLPLLAAGHRAAFRSARTLQKHSRRRVVRHRQLLAGRGRSRRTAFLRHRRPPALRRSQRPHRRRSRRAPCRKTAAIPSPNFRFRKPFSLSNRASAASFAPKPIAASSPCWTPASSACPMVKFSWNRCRTTASPIIRPTPIVSSSGNGRNAEPRLPEVRGFHV